MKRILTWGCIGTLAIIGLMVVLGVIGVLMGGSKKDASTTPVAQQAKSVQPTFTPTIAAAEQPVAAEQPTVAAQPTDAPTPEPPSTNIGVVGIRQEAGGVGVTVMSVSKVNQINDFMTAKDGKIYLVIDVVVENLSRDEETPYNTMYFKVKDADGFEYTSAMMAPDPSLKSGKLMMGDKVRGNVAFEVSQSATGFVMSYEPLVILGGYKPIRIALE